MERSDIPERLIISILSMSSCCLVSVVRIAQSRRRYLLTTVNDGIDDKDVVTNIMS